MTAKKASNTGNRRVVKSQAKTKKAPAKAQPEPSSRPFSGAKKKSNDILPFTKKNYQLLILGIVIIAVGFILLSLDGFVDASKFSISLYIAPLVIVGGFVEIIFAIMYREKGGAETGQAEG